MPFPIYKDFVQSCYFSHINTGSTFYTRLLVTQLLYPFSPNSFISPPCFPITVTHLPTSHFLSLSTLITAFLSSSWHLHEPPLPLTTLRSQSEANVRASFQRVNPHKVPGPECYRSTGWSVQGNLQPLASAVQSAHLLAKGPRRTWWCASVAIIQ